MWNNSEVQHHCYKMLFSLCIAFLFLIDSSAWAMMPKFHQKYEWLKYELHNSEGNQEECNLQLDDALNGNVTRIKTFSEIEDQTIKTTSCIITTRIGVLESTPIKNVIVDHPPHIVYPIKYTLSCGNLIINPVNNIQERTPQILNLHRLIRVSATSDNVIIGNNFELIVHNPTAINNISVKYEIPSFNMASQSLISIERGSMNCHDFDGVPQWLSVPQPSVTCLLNEPLRLRCVSSSNNVYLNHYNLNAEMILLRQNGYVELFIPHCNYTHVGEYDCIAQNANGIIVKNFQVILEGPPEFIEVPENSQVRQGDDLTFSAKVAFNSGDDDVEFSVAKNTEIIMFSLDTKYRIVEETQSRFSFQILNGTSEDSGFYQIKAANKYGLSVYNYELMYS